MANKGLRLAARTLDATAEAVLVVNTWIVLGDSHKIWTDLFLAFLAITAYETLTTMWLGATPAKRLVKVRVVELDGVGRPSPAASLRRGAMCGVLTVIPVIGWTLWAISTLGDSLGRGFPDRVAASMVIPDQFAPPVATRDLAGFADGAHPPRISPYGRVGDLDVRYRARLRRLTDSRLLAAAIGLLALTVSLPFATTSIILLSSAAWIVVFVIHETWLVSRTGLTPGHQLAGLVIRDRRTGLPPRPFRSFLRALVLGLLVYVPLLWPILFVSMLMMGTGSNGRGLHDFAGGTVVVSDPALRPEAQRQKAMRMRLGRAG
ncbi:RDD family protein [Aquihabitans sp. McL0605]|uniref:RDD family protein n=1 Tax=Aquihabitans sp. McL0605 TaxID=3415671 RepID=UPI003CFACF59